MNLERRAWLSIQNPNFTADIKPNEPIPYELFIRNTGPSPAPIERVELRFALLAPGHNVSDEYDKLIREEAWGGVIPPEATIKYDGTISFQPHEIDAITSGRMQMYFLGEWHYDDGLESWFFDRPTRTTRFCLRLDVFAKPDKLRFCPHDNEMN